MVKMPLRLKRFGGFLGSGPTWGDPRLAQEPPSCRIVHTSGIHFTPRGRAVSLSPHVCLRSRFFGGLVFANLLLLLAPIVATTFAQDPNRDPRELAMTEEEGGGKDVVRVADEDCSDERARCLRLRWERDFETDASVGPIVTENKVWVARDLETAKAIYRDQEKLQKEMPERIEYANGPFKWEAPRTPPAEEWTGANACIKDRCDQPGRIDLHQRMVARNKNVVSVVYLFGRERHSTPELLVYFTTRVMERVNPPAPAEGA